MSGARTAPSEAAPFHRIVIASDGSASAGRAFSVAAGLASALRAQLIVLVVVPFYPERTLRAFTGPASVAMAEPEEEEVRYFESVGSRLRKAARARGIDPVASQVLKGHPGVRILSESAARGADLIVVGARGQSPSRRLLLGSVSTALATGSTVPVLVVRGAGAQALPEGGSPVDRIVAAIDGSPPSVRALETAAGLARALAVPLWIVTAVGPASRRVFGAQGARRVEAGRLRQARILVNEARSRAVGLGADPVTGSVLRGSPVDAVLGSLGQDPKGLLIVGSRGRSPATRLLLGSVSTALLHQAMSMVMVVRSPGPGAGGRPDRRA